MTKKLPAKAGIIKAFKLEFLVALVAIAVVVIAVPLPFKPSLWSFIHRKRLDRNLATYTAPIYILDQTSSSDVSFDAYLGWKNSYAVRGFENEKEHSGGYFYYQLAKTGAYGEAYEGPSKSDMEIYNNSVVMKCAPRTSGIEVCAVGNPKRYVAKYDTGDAYLMAEVSEHVLNKDKLKDYVKYPMPYDYLPPKEENIMYYAKIFKMVKPVPIATAKKYFSPEF